jgi:hypothetical protein
LVSLEIFIISTIKVKYKNYKNCKNYTDKAFIYSIPAKLMTLGTNCAIYKGNCLPCQIKVTLKAVHKNKIGLADVVYVAREFF